MVSDTQSRAIAIYQAPPAAVLPLEETIRIAEIFAASGFFQDAKQMAQAVTKILAGRELGFGPMASMQGIHVIQGRTALSANLLAAAIKRSGKYNYRVLEMTHEAVELAFFEWGEEVGRSRFTLEDAKAAGTQNLNKFARNMLFARSLSNGCRWYCPDIFAGGAYTPEELGAPVDGDGDYRPPDLLPSPSAKPQTERPAALIKALADWHEEATRARANGIEPAERDIDSATYDELRESSMRLLKLRTAAERMRWPALIHRALELGIADMADFLPESCTPRLLRDRVDEWGRLVAVEVKARAEAGEEGPAPEALKPADDDEDIPVPF